MNWSKIINIFIVIFLILNIGIFGITKLIEHNRYSISDDRELQVRTVLKNNNYLLYDHLPDYYPMPKIIFETPKTKKDAIVKNIFNEDPYKIAFSARSEQYTSENETLFFYKNEQFGLIKYISANPKHVPTEFTLEEVERVAKEFAETITLSEPKLELTYKKLENEAYTLEYNEVYKGEILFCSYVSIKITKEGIREATMLRYIPNNFTGEEKDIVPIDEVLYNFIHLVKPPEDALYSIKKIDLGYHIATDSQTDNIMVEAVPYYRIKLDNNQVYYVNAYTNKLRTSDE